MTADQRRDDPGRFYDVLNAAGLEYAALSTNGINLFGDNKSIDTAKLWMHGHDQVAWLKSEIVRLQSALTAHDRWQPIETAPADKYIWIGNEHEAYLGYIDTHDDYEVRKRAGYFWCAIEKPAPPSQVADEQATP